MKVRTEARRAAILEVAAQVFLEKGFEGASMSEIAQRVGGSRATLYGYFPSKEEVFTAVIRAKGDTLMREAVDQMAVCGAGDLKPALLRLGEALLEILGTEDAEATQRMVIAEAGRSPIGQLFFEAGPKRVLTSVSQALGEAMQRGEMRRADPGIAAQHLVSLIQAEIHHRWYDPSQPAPNAAEARLMAERAVQVFLNGYAP